MATSLGAQLRALSTIQGRDDASRIYGARTKASLLFEPRKAADIDLQAIFSIAQAGLEELVELNDAFEPFHKTLFSAESTQTDRELQTKDFNDKLNESIASLLEVLSGFVLLPAAQQVLEYLIRRYKIHVYNVDDVMFCILPFHDTSVFVRMVQLLKLEKTRWEFLKGVKQTGAAPPRDVLVQRCTHDNALLEAVCDAGLMGIKPSVNSRAHVTFSCVTVMETLSRIPTVTKETLNRIMPFILRAFDNGATDEYRVGGLMIVALLTSKATLTKNFSVTLLKSVSRAASRRDAQISRLSLMAIIQILQSQELDEFPSKAFKNTLKVKDISVLITDLAKTFDAERFMSLFSSALAEHSVLGGDYEKKFFEMISELNLGGHVKTILSKLLPAGLKKGEDDTNFSAKEFFQKALSAIEKIYPSELDNAVKAFLQEKNDVILKVMDEVFTDSLRKPMEIAGCSLYESIDHPKLEIRKMAVQQISEISLRPQNAEIAPIIREALLRRLSDSDLEVVQVVLSIDGLSELIPPKDLIRPLCDLIHSSMDIVKNGPKPSRSAARSAVEKCLTLIETCLTEQDDDIQKEIQRCLSCYLLVTTKTRKQNLQVLNVSAKCPTLLFEFLPKDISEQPENEISWRTELNDKIVAAIAKSIVGDHTLIGLLLDATATSDNAKRLILLVIPRCFAEEPNENLGKLATKCLPFLCEEWSTLAADIDVQTSVDYHSDLPPKHYLSLGNEKLILIALYRMIPNLDFSAAHDSIYFTFAKFATWQIFKPHLLLFLKPAPNAVLFLLECSVAEGFPPSVQVHSLNILAWFIQKVPMTDEKQRALVIAASIVALANPLKSVRSAARRCLKEIRWEGNVFKPSILLQALHEHSKDFVNDGGFMLSFLVTRLDQGEQGAELTSLIEEALKLPLAMQERFFAILRGLPSTSWESTATEPRFLELLQRRRLNHLTQSSSQENQLNSIEIDILDHLLEMKMKLVCKVHPKDEEELQPIFEALDIEGGSLADPAVIRPCLLTLKFLSADFYSHLDTGFQEAIFESLIELAAVADAKICPAAQQTLDTLQINAAIISKYLGFLYSQDAFTGNQRRKKIKLSENTNNWPGEAKMLGISLALLEFVLRKAKLDAWEGLLNPLFELLRAHLDKRWPKSDTEISQGDREQTGQLVLTVIENILSSEKQVSDLDADLLVEYLRAANDDVTKNHAFSVITAAGRRCPERFLPYVVEIVSIAGSSTVTEDVGHFHAVVQQMLDSVVPFWLQQMKDPRSLLEVFLEALPAVPAHRQTDLVKCVLRVTDESSSISSFLLLLINKHVTESEMWPLSFAERLCMSYDANARISALVKLSTQVQRETLEADADENINSWQILQVSTRFIAAQLQRLEVHLLDNDTSIQDACRTLMEHALQQLQFLSDKKIKAKSEARAACFDAAHLFLDSLTKLMSPSIFCRTVAFLLQNSNNAIRRKVFQIYVSKLQERDTAPKKSRSRSRDETRFMSEVDGHREIVAEISKLLLGEQELSSRTRQAAFSSLNVAVQKFGGEFASTFVSCLPAVLTSFEDEHRPVAVASVRCTASILSSAAAEALPLLPAIMDRLLHIAQRQCSSAETADGADADLEAAVAAALEAAVDKLGGFLSPYLEGVIRVLISPKLNRPADANLSAKFASVRKLTSEQIPARLLLDPLINTYRTAVEESDASTAFIFQMLAVMCSKLDRAGVAAYHVKIFDFCKEALDLRRKQPPSFASVHVVEESVISAVTALVMKLNETTFRPLFVSIQQWAASPVADGNQSIERSIVFYKLVNQLADKLRSVFVPYFRYLLEGCMATLGKSTETKKSKKRKTVSVSADNGPALAKWQLKHLVVSSLHKCFLYDSVGFLDAAKFQQLLPPLADQLVEEAPPELESAAGRDVPSLAEADETLVSCLTRMAFTAGSDVLWKPLNHDVLIKTRSGSARAKRLALEVIKMLAENLREEYLVFIPETIPFLSELLEDQNLDIVAKTQEVIKMLEELSGESLAQYL